MSKDSHHIAQLLDNLPSGPGVYQFFDAAGKLIYIGKAKNLKKRVQSYFQKTTYESYKIKVLVEKTRDIRHIVVNNESDALLLENNLIKEHQPRYNILLKDDKTFPWICIKNEPFPRVFSTRNIIRDGSEYYGPYTSGVMVKTLINLIREMYQLRTCKLNLTDKNIAAGKFRVCLEYHIENCRGPCEGKQSEDSYMESIEQIRMILKGKLSDLIRFLKKQMKQFSGELKYEEAGRIKQKLEILNRFQSKSTIVSSAINNVDVFSIVEKDNYAVVNYLNVSKGAVIQAHTVEIQKKLNESASEILVFAITDLRKRIRSTAREIIVPFDMSGELPWLKTIVPQRGDKKKLLDLSLRNAKTVQLQIEHRHNEDKKVYPAERILKRLRTDLRMEKTPVQIECFDISNIQGSDPVAACVVFKNGKPAKKEYRHYHIRTVSGPNDFASMEEVIFRRYRRLLEEESELPQLIIVDGGKGQLSSAMKSIDKLGLRKKIAVIGIAKKLEEIYFPNDSVPLYIDKNSESLKLIQQLRNEAHRFGISFHRNTRSGKMTRSTLADIPGIGEKTIEELFKRLKSVDAIQQASEDQLEKIVGKSRAKRILEYLEKNQQHVW